MIRKRTLNLSQPRQEHPAKSPTTFGERLKASRLAAGLSMEGLGSAPGVGVTYQTIQDLEKGHSQGTKHILALAKALNVDPNWLLTGRSELVPAVSAPQMKGGVIDIRGREFAEIPVFDIRFAAGAGSAGPTEAWEEEPIDYHVLSISFLRTITDAPLSMICMFQAFGDSMMGTINDRDWVLADMRQRKLTNPGIFALNFEGEGLLKRAAQHLETGAVTLISDNPAYAAQTIKKPDRLLVIGRIFLSIRRH